jgi:branched-chain amino acid aminotransferase
MSAHGLVRKRAKAIKYRHREDTMGFSLALYPIAYRASFDGKAWHEEYIEQPHKTPADEAKLSAKELGELNERRNHFDGVPLVNYTTQYGMGCFEGLKAFPQKGGELKIFRPDENAARFARSMKGLLMPGFPEELFVRATLEVTARNAALGFRPSYKAEWEANGFVSADAVYLRPFSYAESGIGVGISERPSVFVVANPVSSYFKPGSSSAVTSEMIRATHNGTGWIKADSNYVISALAKKKAEDAGFMEVLFLDAEEHRYLEEGSSCNVFFYLKSGELATPALGDTVLPGITRKSVIELARAQGVKVAERKIAIEEVLADAKECFFTGTAAGVSFVESVTHQGTTVKFGSQAGVLTNQLGRELKGIQYGAVPDKHGWMKKV